MFYKISGTNKPVKTSGNQRLVSSIDGLLSAVSEIDNTHIRIYIVEEWQCPNCKVISYSRKNKLGNLQCNYCGKQTKCKS